MRIAPALACLLVVAGGWPLQSAEPPPPCPPEGKSHPANSRAGIAQRRVINAEGAPLAGARIEPYCDVEDVTWITKRWTFGSRQHRTTTTDASGIFNYAQPYCDRVGVLIIAPGYARQLVEVSYGDGLKDVVLGKGTTVTGRLLKDGKPVPDIEVGIAQIDRSSMTFLDEIIAKTDAEGRFALQDVAPHLAYEIHGKRDSLGSLGVTGEKQITSGDPNTTVSVGDLLVEPGLKLTGRLMLANGEPATPKVETLTLPDGRTIQSGGHPVQLHIWRENAYDYQFINLEPDLHFSLLAREKEEVFVSAWVPGYELHADNGMLKVLVKPDSKPVEMVYHLK